MGILNVTPDSFSDGGNYIQLDQAVLRAKQMVEEGADIIDIGGESTRPDSKEVSLEEELRRIIPVIERLSKEVSVPLSVDTYKAEVARQCLEAGA
ncbi:dihydropteroate synthase, partial [Paenibacillus larvae]